MQGSVVLPENLVILVDARSRLSSLKHQKLTRRHDKHPEGETWEWGPCWIHFLAEVAELMDAVGRDNILEEMADVSNMIDILAMMVYAGEGPLPGEPCHKREAPAG